MQRRLAASMMLVLTLIGCERSPTAPPPPPVPPPPILAQLSGTMTVTTVLTATGGYRYTAEIQLAETAGAAATISAVDIVPFDGWNIYPPIATFGPEAWNGGNSIPARGTLTSKPLVATVEVISDSPDVAAVIAFSDKASATSRTFGLTDYAQRIPEPPAGSRFMLIGTVVDAANQRLRDVIVEVLNGANAGRQTPTDEDGAFRLADLKADTFSVRFSKTGYRSTTYEAVGLKSNLSFKVRLEK